MCKVITWKFYGEIPIPLSLTLTLCEFVTPIPFLKLLSPLWWVCHVLHLWMSGVLRTRRKRWIDFSLGSSVLFLKCFGMVVYRLFFLRDLWSEMKTIFILIVINGECIRWGSLLSIFIISCYYLTHLIHLIHFLFFVNSCFF